MKINRLFTFFILIAFAITLVSCSETSYLITDQSKITPSDSSYTPFWLLHAIKIPKEGLSPVGIVAIVLYISTIIYTIAISWDKTVEQTETLCDIRNRNGNIIGSHTRTHYYKIYEPDYVKADRAHKFLGLFLFAIPFIYYIAIPYYHLFNSWYDAVHYKSLNSLYKILFLVGCLALFISILALLKYILFYIWNTDVVRDVIEKIMIISQIYVVLDLICGIIHYLYLN